MTTTGRLQSGLEWVWEAIIFLFQPIGRWVEWALDEKYLYVRTGFLYSAAKAWSMHLVIFILGVLQFSVLGYLGFLYIGFVASSAGKQIYWVDFSIVFQSSIAFMTILHLFTCLLGIGIFIFGKHEYGYRRNDFLHFCASFSMTMTGYLMLKLLDYPLLVEIERWLANL